jgi:hypothetical protein
MSLFGFAKSGCKAAFFLGFALFHAWASAWIETTPEKTLALSQQPVWQSLLHMSGQQSDLNDPQFLLSAPEFSAAKELRATLQLLQTAPLEAACRFPARVTWLSAALGSQPPSMAHCSDLQEFFARAPADRLDLMFASESLSQPATMMGHSFLRLTGQRANGEEVEHGVTFFTEAGGYNLPKLLVESMVLGKPGFFALSPFKEERDRYLLSEQRALWSYTLKLDQDQKRLIQMHLQELKQVQLTYFFQSYNCATLLQHVLGVSGQLPPHQHWWSTPKDVVQAAAQAGMIESVSVEQPDGWVFRTLSTQVPQERLQTVMSHVRHGTELNLPFNTQEPNDLLLLMAGVAYGHWLLQESGKSEAPEGVRMRIQALAEEQSRFEDYSVNHAAALNPANHPGDSQIGVRVRQRNGQSTWILDLLPASHQLHNDNRGYTQETELQLFGLSVAMSESGRVRLDEMVLYSMQSLAPHHPVLGSLSSKATIRWGDNPSQIPGKSKGWRASMALGRTWRVHDDMDVFVMAGAGLGRFEGRTWLPVTAELGMVIREVGNMKTVFSHEQRKDLLNNPSIRHSTRITQSWHVTSSINGYARIMRSNLSKTEYEIGLSRLF